MDDLSTGSLHNIDDYLQLNNFRFMEQSICSISLSDLPEKIDYVFHLAAKVSVPESFENPSEFHDVNELGFLKILEIARMKSVEKLIYASSSAVYGSQGNIPISEKSKLNPQSPYALNKFNNELYARKYFEWFKLRSVGLRFFNVYGPRQRSDSPYSGVISIFRSKMAKGEEITIYGDGNQVRDFINVKDVAKILRYCSVSESNEFVYNVGTGVPTSINELYSLIRNNYNYTSEPIYKEKRIGDIPYSLADVSLLNDNLKISSNISIEQGINSLIKTNSKS